MHLQVADQKQYMQLCMMPDPVNGGLRFAHDQSTPSRQAPVMQLDTTCLQG